MTKMEEVSAKRKQAGKKGLQKRWGKNEEEKGTTKKKKIRIIYCIEFMINNSYYFV